MCKTDPFQPKISEYQLKSPKIQSFHHKKNCVLMNQYKVIVKLTEQNEIMLKSNIFPLFDKVLLLLQTISTIIQIQSNKWYTRMHW